MADSTRNVLFLCTGNSARSVLGEGILNKLGRGRFRGYSAGSRPTGTVNPLAVEQLELNGCPVDGLRSKSFDEFGGDAAVAMDFVFTVCDSAAGEACPLWPGHPVTAHWGIPDPAAVEGTVAERQAAFATAYAAMHTRISRFLALPLDTLSPEKTSEALDAIGREEAIA